MPVAVGELRLERTLREGEIGSADPLERGDRLAIPERHDLLRAGGRHRQEKGRGKRESANAQSDPRSRACPVDRPSTHYPVIRKCRGFRRR